MENNKKLIVSKAQYSNMIRHFTEVEKLKEFMSEVTYYSTEDTESRLIQRLKIAENEYKTRLAIQESIGHEGNEYYSKLENVYNYILEQIELEKVNVAKREVEEKAEAERKKKEKEEKLETEKDWYGSIKYYLVGKNFPSKEVLLEEIKKIFDKFGVKVELEKDNSFVYECDKYKLNLFDKGQCISLFSIQRTGVVIDTHKILVELRKSEVASHTLAKEIGISKQTISQLKNGNKDVNTLTIQNAKKIQVYFERPANGKA